MSASVTSSAPPSTITIASFEAASTRSMSDWPRCSKVGLATNWPSTRPTRTPAIGPLNGMSEHISAAEAAVMPCMSDSFSWSLEITEPITWVSYAYPSGNSGRQERSMRREVRVSFSVSRPSRLK